MIDINSIKLKEIDKPARYVGGEVNVVIKSSKISNSIVLCYPNLYEKAMSKNVVNLLYNNINLIEDVWCKRCFAPDLDFEKLLRVTNTPIYSLEDYKSIKENDILLFVLDNEMDYTNVINILEMAKVSLNKNDRKIGEPKIWFLSLNNINTLPLKHIADKVFESKSEKESVQDILNLLNNQSGETVKIKHITSGIIPSIKINNSSIIVDFDYLQDSDIIIKYIEKSRIERGINKVSFLNYNKIDEYKFCEIVYKIKMNLPDIRILSKNIDFNFFKPELLDVLFPCMEKASVYFNVITASSKLIEKTNVGTDKAILIKRLEKVFKNNRNSIKLDFNVGLLDETYEDIDNIFELLEDIVKMYSTNKAKDKFSMKVNILYYISDSISDKKASINSVNKLEIKSRYISEKKYDSVIKLEMDNISSYETKALLKNGKENVFRIIYDAYKLGARFDNDNKKYNKIAWEKAIYDSMNM